ncbi:hypothetical protein E2320_005064, partial [Naja naja]
APRTDSSLEIASAAKDELPDSNICFCYERIFCIQQAKVDHSENESEEIAVPRCHFLIPLRLLPFILALFLILIIATAIALSGEYKLFISLFQLQRGFSAHLPLNVLIKQQDVMASSIAKTEKMSTDVFRNLADCVFRWLERKLRERHIFVSSSGFPVAAIENEFQKYFVTANRWLSADQQTSPQNATDLREECISGNVIVLKCLGPGTPHVLLVEMCPCSSNGHGKPAFSFKDITCVGGQSSPDGGLLQQPTVFMRAWSVHVGLVILEESPVNPHLVDKIIYHKNYKPKTMKNDIALIKLATPLALNGLIEPICLPNFGEHFPEGKMCWISGWGATEEGGDTSETMKYAGVPLISNKVCNHGEIYGGIVASSMLCAGFLKGGIDTCQGDSGGPLACKDMNTWKLVGTTSFGVGCAEENKPGVYSRITSFLDWIHEQME